VLSVIDVSCGFECLVVLVEVVFDVVDVCDV